MWIGEAEGYRFSVKTLRWIPAGVWRLPEGGLSKSYTVSLARSSNMRRKFPIRIVTGRTTARNAAHIFL